MKVFIIFIKEGNDLFKANISSNFEKTNTNTIEFDKFDNKPLNIGNSKKFDIAKLSEFPKESNKDNIQTTLIDENTEEVKETHKRPAKIKRQKPKYDARKAIEDAKLKENTKEKESIIIV